MLIVDGHDDAGLHGERHLQLPTAVLQHLLLTKEGAYLFVLFSYDLAQSFALQVDLFTEFSLSPYLPLNLLQLSLKLLIVFL